MRAAPALFACPTDSKSLFRERCRATKSPSPTGLRSRATAGGSPNPLKRLPSLPIERTTAAPSPATAADAPWRGSITQKSSNSSAIFSSWSPCALRDFWTLKTPPSSKPRSASPRKSSEAFATKPCFIRAFSTASRTSATTVRARRSLCLRKGAPKRRSGWKMPPGR